VLQYLIVKHFQLPMNNAAALVPRAAVCGEERLSNHHSICSWVMELKNQHKMYKSQRPELCFLCRGPVVDAGVRIGTLDKEKLSNWCLEYLQTEFDYERLKMRTKIICQFCVWDAR